MYIVRHKKRNSNQQQLAKNLNDISNFLQSNQLIVNQDKTQILETMLPQKMCKIEGNASILAVLDNKNTVKILEAEQHIRWLGMNIGGNLNWTPHLTSREKPLLSELQSKIGVLSLLKKELPRTARLTLTNRLIMSCLQYTMSVWGGLPASKMKLLQSVLNSAARFVTGMKRSTSAVKLMACCNWLFARELAKFQSLLSMWRIVNDSQSNYFDSKISINDVLTLSTLPAHLKMTARSFRWRMVIWWNSLSLSVRESPMAKIFKRRLNMSILANRIHGIPQ